MARDPGGPGRRKSVTPPAPPRRKKPPSAVSGERAKTRYAPPVRRETPVSPDQQDRRRAAREQNIERGAAPTGGPGVAEKRRAVRLFKRIQRGRASVAEIQRTLRREGYDLKVDNTWGPETQKAFGQYQQALEHSQRANLLARQRDYIAEQRRLLEAGQVPSSNYPLEARLFGEEGVRGLEIMRRQARGLEHRERMAEFEAQDRLEDEDSFLESMQHGISRAWDTYQKIGKLSYEGGRALIEGVLKEVKENPSVLLAPVDPKVLATSRPVQELGIGVELVKASRGEEFDPRWAAVEMALLPLGIGKVGAPIRKALQAARRSKQAVKAALAPQEAIELREGLSRIIPRKGIDIPRPEVQTGRVADETGLPPLPEGVRAPDVVSEAPMPRGFVIADVKAAAEKMENEALGHELWGTVDALEKDLVSVDQFEDWLNTKLFLDELAGTPDLKVLQAIARDLPPDARIPTSIPEEPAEAALAAPDRPPESMVPIQELEQIPTAPTRKIRSATYYRTLLKGRDPDVIAALGRKPDENTLGLAFDVARRKGDFNAMALLQEDVENVTQTLGPQARGLGGVVTSPGRTVRYGRKDVQFPESPSRITALGQRLFDRASERMTARVDILREGESRLARGLGEALTPASARGRVPKRQGRWQEKEARRRKALRAQEIRKLRPAHFGRNEATQFAHSFYIELPAEYRNAEGLDLIRQATRRELEEYTSGAASRKISARIEEIKAEMKAADEPSDVFRLMQERGELQADLADITARIKSLGERVNKLDKVIEKPVKVDEEIIEAGRVLMDDRYDILARAGKIDPEVAADRTGIISRYLGLEPSGDEVYFGHRMNRVRGARSSLFPGGLSVGAVRLPEGVATKNKLQLVKTGRERRSLEVLIEDWQAAQVYDFHNIAREDLGPGFGTKLVDVPGLKPGPDDIVVNARGQELPRHWKIDDEARAAEEGFDPEDVLIKDVEAYIRNYIAEGADADRLIKESVEAGHLDDLYVVPRDVVKRYYSQFLPVKITSGSLPGVKEGATVIGRGIDLLNDALYTSLIYANPGYIPANTAANLIMAGLHQGAFLPVNLARSGQLLATGPQRLKDLIRAEIGQGPTVALSSGTKGFKQGASAVSRVADDPYRISAFIHEAARLGIIPKVKPKLSAADYKALEDFLTNPKWRAQLNDVSDRATQAMVDFDRLGAREKAFAKRMLFVWSWIRGATRYPGRFALDHPARSMFLIYGAAGAPGAPIDLEPITEWGEEGMPPWLAGALGTGEVTVGGKTYPQVLPTRSISPLSTPFEVFSDVTGRPGARPAIEYINPGVQSAINVVGKRSPWGAQVDSYREAVAQAAERLTPLGKLGTDLISPSEEAGLYPEDVTRLGRAKRALRVLPIAVDPEEAYKARKRLGMEGDREEIERKELIQESREAGLGDPPEDVLEDLRYRTEVDKGWDDLSPMERAKKLAKLYDERNGGNRMGRFIKRIDNDAEASYFTGKYRRLLYPELLKYERRIELEEDRRIEDAG